MHQLADMESDIKDNCNSMFKKLLLFFCFIFFIVSLHGSKIKSIIKQVFIQKSTSVYFVRVPIVSYFFLCIFLEFPYIFINKFENTLIITTFCLSKGLIPIFLHLAFHA